MRAALASSFLLACSAQAAPACPQQSMPVDLCAYYDPDSHAYQLIDLSVVSAWSGESVALADFISGTNVSGQNPSLVSWQEEFPTVAFVQALQDGSTIGVSATSDDLNAWRAAHPGLTVDLVTRANTFYDPNAVPAVAFIDPRTLDVLSTEVGFGPSGGDAQIRSWLAWRASH